MRARRFGAVALTMALCTPGAAFAAPDSVHPVKMALGGGYQEAPGDLVKRKASHRDIINLAQARSTETKVPGNEILALTIDCGTGEVQLVVWDVGTEMTIVAVSAVFSMTDDIAIQDKKNGDAGFAFSIGDLNFNTTGDATWGITDGELTVAARVKYGDVEGSVCPVAVKATLSGVVEVVADGDSVDLLVIKGKAGAGKPIKTTP